MIRLERVPCDYGQSFREVDSHAGVIRAGSCDIFNVSGYLQLGSDSRDCHPFNDRLGAKILIFRVSGQAVLHNVSPKNCLLIVFKDSTNN